MRMQRQAFLAITLLAATCVQAGLTPETVAFPSGEKVLLGLLYKPSGKGPFPAVLYNDGGSEGLTSNAAFEAIAPHFIEKGWVFFAPYRRGQGLSADAGTLVGKEISAAVKEGGFPAGDAILVRLLSGEQLSDQLAAAHWLEAQSFVQAKRVAVMGNSFGGI